MSTKPKCNHKRIVYTYEGEIVCKDCGMVLGGIDKEVEEEELESAKRFVERAKLLAPWMGRVERAIPVNLLDLYHGPPRAGRFLDPEVKRIDKALVVKVKRIYVWHPKPGLKAEPFEEVRSLTYMIPDMVVSRYEEIVELIRKYYNREPLPHEKVLAALQATDPATMGSLPASLISVITGIPRSDVIPKLIYLYKTGRVSIVHPPVGGSPPRPLRPLGEDHFKPRRRVLLAWQPIEVVSPSMVPSWAVVYEEPSA